VHERAARVASVPIAAPAPTLAVAWGDWLGPLSLALAALLGLPRRAGAQRTAKTARAVSS
jgi:hypothetical protein